VRAGSLDVAGLAPGSDHVIVVHGVEIDPARRRVRVAGADVTLTNQEFHLLHLLATHPGIVFSREALLSRIWKNETFVTERSVDTLVKRVRRKIGDDAANPRLILTVWGVGYKFADV
jgi:DNA-binding response OmpR family regulator